MRIGLYGAVIAICIACHGTPVPTDKKEYVGEWQSPSTFLLITRDGNVHYKRQRAAGTTTLDLPLKRFEGHDFVVGIGPFSTTFNVSKPPYRDSTGKWRIVIDGVELTRQ